MANVCSSLHCTCSHLPNTRNSAIWVSMFTLFIWWQLHVYLIFNYMYMSCNSYCESVNHACIFMPALCVVKRLLSCDNQSTDIWVLLMHMKKKSNDSPNFPHVVSGLTFYISKIYYRVWWLFEWKPFSTFSRIYFLVFLQIKFKLKNGNFLVKAKVNNIKVYIFSEAAKVWN